MDSLAINLNYMTNRCDWMFAFANPYYWQLMDRLGCICHDEEYKFDVPPPKPRPNNMRSLIAAQTIGKQRLADNGYKRSVVRGFLRKAYYDLPQEGR